MKNILKKMNVLLIIMVALSLFVGCGKKAEETDTQNDVYEQGETGDNSSPADETQSEDTESSVIVMGTNAEFAPFEYIEGGEIVGFDIEIAEKIAEKLGKELKIENMDFGGLISALENKKVDFVIAGMTVTEDRKKAVNFSENYFEASQMIVVKKDNTEITSKDDLVGKELGVQLGTTGESEANSIEGAKVSSYNAAYAAIMDLTNGKVDAVILDSEPASKFAAENDKIKVLDQELTKESYAIAVNKEDPELLTAINETIQELKDNGEYDKLFNKYFGEQSE